MIAAMIFPSDQISCNTGKNITRLLPLALLLVLRTRNNTDGNKLVIFSSIASYYGDNYILSVVDTTFSSFKNRIWDHV